MNFDPTIKISDIQPAPSEGSFILTQAIPTPVTVDLVDLKSKMQDHLDMYNKLKETYDKVILAAQSNNLSIPDNIK